MLTAKQFETIGRLTIGFNEIDFLIGAYTTAFLGTHEWEMAKVISARDHFFRQRKDLLLAILEVLGEEYPDLRLLVSSVEETVGRAEALSKQRNSVVHGLIIIDEATGQVGLRYRERDFAWGGNALDKIAFEVRDVAGALAQHCYELSEALREVRGTAIHEEGGSPD